jgi:Ca2+-binding EF-hand superfamily protein
MNGKNEEEKNDKLSNNHKNSETNQKKDPEFKMDFPEFVLFLISNMQDNFTIKKSLKQSFSQLDRNDDGFITKDELKAAFQDVEEDISEE